MPAITRKRLERFIEPLRVEPGRRVRLPRDFPTTPTQHATRREARELLAQGVELLAEYQARLAAQDTYGVVVVLQAMDAAGKDGTIRHVMSGVNPQGVEVHGFKAPSSTELDHDYLWRYQRKLPERGHIGIFNRSHYEEVLVVRVHPQILKAQQLPPSARRGDIWDRRFREINDWEHYLTDQGYRFVKLFLNVSKEVQRERFLSRIDEPQKNWKFSGNDARERAYWDDYQKAFAAVLSNTSTPWAPWYVIPADDKPFARVAAAAVLAHVLMDIDPRYPTISPEAKASLQDAKVILEAEAPAGTAHADEDSEGTTADPANARNKDKDRRKRKRGDHR